MKEYAFKKLTAKQSKHSKMKNVHYETIDMQKYLTSELKVSEKRMIFKFRVRMAKFGENYRGGEKAKICPLCHLHLDNQEMSFQCPIIRKEINIQGNINDIYRTFINKETVHTIMKISELRKCLES